MNYKRTKSSHTCNNVSNFKLLYQFGILFKRMFLYYFHQKVASSILFCLIDQNVKTLAPFQVHDLNPLKKLPNWLPLKNIELIKQNDRGIFAKGDIFSH